MIDFATPRLWTVLLTMLGSLLYSHLLEAKLTGNWQLLQVLNNHQLEEVSGMSFGLADPGLIWMVNDSGNNNLLHAVDAVSGAHLAAIKITGVSNHDWEDLTSFRLHQQAWILVADIGNHPIRRELVKLYLLREPTPDSNGRYPSSIEPAAIISFNYEDGSRDAEALTVDIEQEQIILVSKRDQQPRVYVLPLVFETPDKPLTAKLVGEIQYIQDTRALDHFQYGFFSRYISQPTGLAIDYSRPDATSMAMLTYSKVYLYQRQPGMSWLQALLGEPQIVQLPPIMQSEAACFDPRGDLLISSEQNPSPIYRLNLSTPQ